MAVPLSSPQASDTLDAIYDAALRPERWPIALTRLAAQFHAAFADRYTRTHDRSWEVGTAVGLDESDYREQFLGVWSKRNVWSARRPVKEAGEIVTTRDILPKEDLIRSEMYTDYLRPRGLHEGLRLAIWAGAEGIEDISLLRPWSMGCYSADEIELADVLMPHLRRAAAISRRLAAAEQAASAYDAALEHLTQPVLVLDASGRVLHANDRAVDALGRQDTLAASTAGLRAATLSATVQLQRALAEATRLDGPQLSATLRLPSRSGGADTALTLIPLKHAEVWSGRPGPAALAVLSGPPARADVVRERMMEAYKLTEAEAAIVGALAHGESVSQIAKRSQRSVHTVRSHLARIMAKTGAARQSDVVRIAITFSAGP